MVFLFDSSKKQFGLVEVEIYTIAERLQHFAIDGYDVVPVLLVQLDVDVRYRYNCGTTSAR